MYSRSHEATIFPTFQPPTELTGIHTHNMLWWWCFCGNRLTVCLLVNRFQYSRWLSLLNKHRCACAQWIIFVCDDDGVVAATVMVTNSMQQQCDIWFQNFQGARVARFTLACYGRMSRGARGTHTRHHLIGCLLPSCGLPRVRLAYTARLRFDPATTVSACAERPLSTLLHARSSAEFLLPRDAARRRRRNVCFSVTPECDGFLTRDRSLGEIRPRPCRGGSVRRVCVCV